MGHGIAIGVVALHLVAIQGDTGPAVMQGPAGTALTAQSASGAVTLAVDPALKDGRLSVRIVAVNRTGQPQPFGPASVAITVNGRPVAIATADQLLRRPSDRSSRNSPLARAAAAPEIEGFGQRDPTMANNPADLQSNMPDERYARDDTNPGGKEAEALRNALLKPSSIAPQSSASGAILTDKVGRKAAAVAITVSFAGEAYRFATKLN